MANRLVEKIFNLLVNEKKEPFGCSPSCVSLWMGYKHNPWCPWLENSLQTCFMERLPHVDKGYRAVVLRKISDSPVLTATKEVSQCSKERERERERHWPSLLKVEVSVNPVLRQQLQFKQVSNKVLMMQQWKKPFHKHVGRASQSIINPKERGCSVTALNAAGKGREDLFKLVGLWSSN